MGGRAPFLSRTPPTAWGQDPGGWDSAHPPLPVTHLPKGIPQLLHTDHISRLRQELRAHQFHKVIKIHVATHWSKKKGLSHAQPICSLLSLSSLLPGLLHLQVQGVAEANVRAQTRGLSGTSQRRQHRRKKRRPTGRVRNVKDEEAKTLARSRRKEKAEVLRLAAPPPQALTSKGLSRGGRRQGTFLRATASSED